MKETLTVTEKEMTGVAEKILSTLAKMEGDDAKVLFLEGDLGAGKTTFTKEIAQHLGIVKEDVHSPTFILKKEYRASHPTFKKLIHIDAYRFEREEEATVLRLEDDIEDPSSLIVIEWPSKMKYKQADMLIMFKVIDDETRELEINI